MKTIIICLLFLAGSLKAGDLPGVKTTKAEYPAGAVWEKTENGIWMASYNVWYKIDKKTSELKYSYNKKKWKTADNAVWHDNRGRWYCIMDNKIMYSDNGKNWLQSDNRSWQDMNGVWVRLDTDLNLYQAVK